MLYLLSTTRVTNSRFFRRQNTVWRRRQTPDGVVFTTRERLDFEQITVINDGVSSPYKPGKIYLSLLRACDHLDDADDVAWHIKTTVEEKLVAILDETLTLTVEDIAKMALKTLKLYNTSAYVKYASYYPELVSPRKLAATIR